MSSGTRSAIASRRNAPGLGGTGTANSVQARQNGRFTQGQVRQATRFQ